MKRKVYRRTVQSTRKAYSGLIIGEDVASLPLTAANFKAWAESHNNAMSDFLAKARAWAGAVLRAAGLPDDMRDVLVQPDGTWQELPPGWNDWPLERQLEQYPKGFSVCSADRLAKDRMLESGELTMADHAAAVVRYADEMERAIRDGAAAQAAACGVRLGEAWQRAMFAEHAELPAAIGMASIDAGLNPKPSTDLALFRRDAAETVAALQKEANAIWAIAPRLSKSEVARQIALKTGKSYHYIRQKIDRSK